MANVLVEEQTLKDIADNIRVLSDDAEATFKPAEMVQGVYATYNTGYIDGYDEGYDTGDSDGFTDGYNKGYDEGYSDGEAEGGGTDEQWNGYWLKTMTEAVIPEGATVIPEEAFSGQSNLESVELPNTVTSIGAWAFMECISLASIRFPNNLKYIGEEAFGATALCGTLILPASLLRIETYAFVDPQFNEVIFEGTPQYIASDAFLDMEGILTTIKCPWSAGQVPGAPWGADEADIIYEWEV